MTAMAVQRMAEIQSLFAAMQTQMGGAAQWQPSSADPVGGTQNFAAQLAQATAPATTGAAAAVAPAAGLNAAGAAVPYAKEIDAAAAKYGLDPALLRGLVKQESGFDPNARSGVGALGLTQLMPGTARELGVTDPTDPAQAIDGGAKYLKQQLDKFGGDTSKALAAYNAGPGAVLKYGGIPPFAETQNYVKSILAIADSYRAQGSSAQTVATPAVAASPSAYGSIT